MNLTPTPKPMTQRPQVLEGITHCKETGSGKVYVTINEYDGQPMEVFVALGRAGSEERALTEAIGRLCSLALQYGVDINALRRKLRGISSENVYGIGPNKVLSVADAIGQTMEELYGRDQQTPLHLSQVS